MDNRSVCGDEGKGGGWGRVPRWIADPNPKRTPPDDCDGAIIASMRRSDALVYLGLAAHANGRTWTAKLSQRRLAALSGLHVATVNAAINRLVKLGAIVKHAGPNGARASYELVSTDRSRPTPRPFAPAPPTVRADARTLDAQADRSRDDAPFAPDAATVRAAAADRSRPGANETEEQKERTESHPARAEESSNARDASPPNADGVAHATAEGEPDTTAGGSPTLPHVEPADLRDLWRLMAWAERWTGRPPRVDSRQFERLAAAAVRAVDRGRDPARFFVGVVRGGCRGVSERDLDTARDWIKTEAHSHRPARGETQEEREARQRAAGDAESDRLRRLHGHRVSEGPPATAGATALGVLAKIAGDDAAHWPPRASTGPEADQIKRP